MNARTDHIDNRNVYVVARNEIEAVALAKAAFQRNFTRRSNLVQATSKKPVWRCTMLGNGEILAGQI